MSNYPYYPPEKKEPKPNPKVFNPFLSSENNPNYKYDDKKYGEFITYQPSKKDDQLDKLSNIEGNANNSFNSGFNLNFLNTTDKKIKDDSDIFIYKHEKNNINYPISKNFSEYEVKSAANEKYLNDNNKNDFLNLLDNENSYYDDKMKINLNEITIKPYLDTLSVDSYSNKNKHHNTHSMNLSNNDILEKEIVDIKPKEKSHFFQTLDHIDYTQNSLNNIRKCSENDSYQNNNLFTSNKQESVYLDNFQIEKKEENKKNFNSDHFLSNFNTKKNDFLTNTDFYNEKDKEFYTQCSSKVEKIENYGNYSPPVRKIKNDLPALFSKSNSFHLNKPHEMSTSSNKKKLELDNFDSSQKKNSIKFENLKKSVETPKITINGQKFAPNIDNIFEKNDDLRQSIDFSENKLVLSSNKKSDFKFLNEPIIEEQSFSKIEKQLLSEFDSQKEINSNTFASNPLIDQIFHENHWKTENFAIGASLGRGKFSNVYIAKDKKTNYLVALKIIQKQVLKECEAEKALAQEIKIQSFCNHPNILKLYGFINEEERIILILEYAANGELYKEMKSQPNKRFTEYKASLYIRQILEAIKYLHSNNIIHRDIKPENIINSFGVLKLSDFGWAAFNPNGGRKNTFCGTLDYVAPEIVEGVPYDAMVDIWSIGVLCYELCYGEPPFVHESTSETYLNIINIRMDIPNYFSYDLRDLLNKILKKKSYERISLDNIINHPWIERHNSNSIQEMKKSGIIAKVNNI